MKILWWLKWPYLFTIIHRVSQKNVNNNFERRKNILKILICSFPFYIYRQYKLFFSYLQESSLRVYVQNFTSFNRWLMYEKTWIACTYMQREKEYNKDYIEIIFLLFKTIFRKPCINKIKTNWFSSLYDLYLILI